MLSDSRSRNAAEILEEYADGRASTSELAASHEHARRARDAIKRQQSSDSDWLAGYSAAASAALFTAPNPFLGQGNGEFNAYKIASTHAAAAMAKWRATAGADESQAKMDELYIQCAILRDLAGNSFQPMSIEADWLTKHVVDLANYIYDEREFSYLPMLGDSLQQAGCNAAEVLSHCREQVRHERGCWVVDALTGRA